MSALALKVADVADGKAANKASHGLSPERGSVWVAAPHKRACAGTDFRARTHGTKLAYLPHWDAHATENRRQPRLFDAVPPAMRSAMMSSTAMQQRARRIGLAMPAMLVPVDGRA
ncbi:hypothetical protein DWU98_16525 [Dyella monticola]|uniref:Uncharacterized protein n=1 Tax=Dyella monticola TaxID=1927958 RepID=A0A370WU77_9GAMM|nr:hypothetical protein DWU98_16525 [Dyella monticola]